MTTMGRLQRIKYSGAWYHVMNRGAGRKKIYDDEEHYLLFLSILEEITKKFKVKVHTYCLMSNHYHLLLQTMEPNLDIVMKYISGSYTKTYNKWNDSDGPIFRGRYHAKLVDSDLYLIHLSRYIHLNPVEAGITAKPEDYEWSSYAAYLKTVKRPSWICYDIINKWFLIT